jgi:hypothetical protein
MSITQYTVRIANYLDGSGNEYAWTTSTGARRNLGTSPMITGAQLGILDPIASSGGMVWELTGPPAELQPLTRRDLELPLGATAPVRLKEFCDNSSTSLVLDTAGLTTPQYVFVGGETMLINNEPSPGIYDVTRGIGSLGVARTHQWLEESQPQPLVLAKPSNPVGMRVSVEDQNANVVYRGVLRSVSRTDHGCALDIVSMVGWLRERRQSPVDARPSNANGYGSLGINVTERVVQYPYTFFDSWAPQRVRIWMGEVWVVVQNDTPVLFGNEIYEFAIGNAGSATPVLQWGKGATAYPLNSPPKELADKSGLEFYDPAALVPTRVESLWTHPQDTPSNVLQALLTADWPPGQVAGMDPSDVGDLTVLDDAYGVGNLIPPYSDDPGALWWAGGNKGSVMLSDAIAQNLMAPMLCALTADGFGRIMAIDWLRCLGNTQTVLEAELMRGLGAVGDTQPVRIVRWEQTELGGQQVLNFQSDLVSQVVGGGREIAVKPGWVQNAAGWMYDRLAAVLQVYQLSVPTITIQVTKAKALAIGLEPGLVLGLTCSTLWNRQGLRGVVDMDGIVLSVSRRLHAEAGTVDAVLALTGYTVQVNQGKWGPSATVVSFAGSTITMTMDNGDDVDDWFTTGDAVALTDPTGLVLDGSITVTSSNATSITVSGLGVTPAPDDRIEVATYSVAQYADTAYLGEGFDYV